MKIATWNVNSLRVRLPQVLEWLESAAPDVLAVQETKLVDADFPVAELEAAGYRAAFAGQKTYNGVAVLARSPLAEVVNALPGADDPQRRLLAVTCRGVRAINVYVPNGASVDSDKYVYKLQWLERLRDFLRGELQRYQDVVVLGDFNIAPEPRDVYDPAAWEGKVLFSEPERAAFRSLMDLGLVDTFRRLEDAAGHYSWWDYRMGAFRRNMGLRIDHILASADLSGRLRSCTIEVEPRRAERPSDHAPVVAEFGD